MLLVPILGGWQSAWASEAGYPSQPAIHDGATCLSAADVVCFESGTMHKRWDALAGHHPFEPVAADGTLLIGSSAGLHALDLQTGVLRWTWRESGEVFSPSTDGDAVYATDKSGRVSGIDLETGEVRWQRQFEGWLYTPAVVADQVITGGRGAVLYSLAQHTGQTMWTRALDQELVSRPVATGDGLVVTTFDGSIIKFDPEGAVLWKQKDPSPSFSPTAGPEILVFGGMDGVLRGRDPDTGALRWTLQLSGQLFMPAWINGDSVGILSPDGELVVADAADGQLLHRQPVPGTPLGGPVTTTGGGWRVFFLRSGIISWTDASMN